MDFKELEKIMAESNVNSLAQIARILDTTPQAVSNWKSRNQVPFRIINKIRNFDIEDDRKSLNFDGKIPLQEVDENTISVSDILLIVAQQTKLTAIVTFVAVFLNFIEVDFNPIISSSFIS